MPSKPAPWAYDGSTVPAASNSAMRPRAVVWARVNAPPAITGPSDRRTTAFTSGAGPPTYPNQPVSSVPSGRISAIPACEMPPYEVKAPPSTAPPDGSGATARAAAPPVPTPESKPLSSAPPAPNSARPPRFCPSAFEKAPAARMSPPARSATDSTGPSNPLPGSNEASSAPVAVSRAMRARGVPSYAVKAPPTTIRPSGWRASAVTAPLRPAPVGENAASRVPADAASSAPADAASPTAPAMSAAARRRDRLGCDAGCVMRRGSPGRGRGGYTRGGGCHHLPPWVGNDSTRGRRGTDPAGVCREPPPRVMAPSCGLHTVRA